jgi:hypothetical protein
MENFETFLEFENGVLITNDSKIHAIVSTVKSIVEPIIFERRLSGKIRIVNSNDNLNIRYDGVTPFEYVPELMRALRKASSFENFA